MNYVIPANIETPYGELQKTKFWMIQGSPSTLVEGLAWYDSTAHLPKYYDGTNVKEFGRVYTAGSNINISNGEISLSTHISGTIYFDGGADLVNPWLRGSGTTLYGYPHQLTNGQDYVDIQAKGSSVAANTKFKVEGTTIYDNSTGLIPDSIISTNIARTSDIPTVPSKISDLTDDTATYPIDKADTLTNLTATITELNYVDGVTSNVQTQLNNKIASSLKGAINGVAELDSNGKVPLSQLPSFVDDVIDAYIRSGATALSETWLSTTSGGPVLTPEEGKIYVILSSGTYLNKTYRWSGSTYVEISASPGAASESAAGIIEIATNSEVTTGTDDTRAVTPKKLADNYQAKLVSGTNIKTINNTSLLGGGNISISVPTKISNLTDDTSTNPIDKADTLTGLTASIAELNILDGATLTTTELNYVDGVTSNIQTQLNAKQATLVSGTSIKTIGGSSLLGSGDISVAKKYSVTNPALTISGGVATWEITSSNFLDTDLILVVKNVSTGETIFPAWKTSGSYPSIKITVELLASANVSAGTYKAIVMYSDYSL